MTLQDYLENNIILEFEDGRYMTKIDGYYCPIGRVGEEKALEKYLEEHPNKEDW